ncbi:MAG TPA: SPOR domain-containing protein [Candidatus Acidoferrales bacterium]|nr:SPOR domain-containing protein [Candidatus Acidoferrales bacterium]
MRFEIRAGGAFLIFIGLVALSGAVFALGLVAGHEMFRQNQPDLSQISTTYPMPSAPVGGSTPASAASSMSAGTPAVAAASAAVSPSTIRPPAPPVAAASPAARPSVAAIARVKPPARAINPPAPETDEDAPEARPPVAAAAPVTPPSTGTPYNIQIEAVMDKSGADEMVSRLKTLGYNAQEMKTALNGQTWYRVRVGPYNSQEEAKAAQDKLREQYKQAYTTSH